MLNKPIRAFHHHYTDDLAVGSMLVECPVGELQSDQFESYWTDSLLNIRVDQCTPAVLYRATAINNDMDKIWGDRATVSDNA